MVERVCIHKLAVYDNTCTNRTYTEPFHIRVKDVRCAFVDYDSARAGSVEFIAVPIRLCDDIVRDDTRRV
jgi:hypothetical protein